jgi:hypothetical protein
MREDANAIAERQQQLLMLASLLRIREHLLAFSASRSDDSRVGKAPIKERHRQDGALLIDSHYFLDNATHTPKDFWRRFR